MNTGFMDGLGCCFLGFSYYLNYGYQRIADMQSMEKKWQKKAPWAHFITCNGKPCMEVTGPEYTNKYGDRFLSITYSDSESKAISSNSP